MAFKDLRLVCLVLHRSILMCAISASLPQQMSSSQRGWVWATSVSFSICVFFSSYKVVQRLECLDKSNDNNELTGGDEEKGGQQDNNQRSWSSILYFTPLLFPGRSRNIWHMKDMVLRVIVICGFFRGCLVVKPLHPVFLINERCIKVIMIYLDHFLPGVALEMQNKCR